MNDLAAPEKSRLTELEAWWAFLVRVLSFILGAAILVTQIGAERDRLYLIVAAIGLCGPAVAQSVATVFASIRSGETPHG